jgi:hypothetical protein
VGEKDDETYIHRISREGAKSIESEKRMDLTGTNSGRKVASNNLVRFVLGQDNLKMKLD